MNARWQKGNFSLKEVSRSRTAKRLGIDNAPKAKHLANAITCCAGLEEVRAMLGHPMAITSWFRSKALNNAIRGASKTSSHMKGFAADFTCKRFGNTLKIVHAIVKSGIQFDQIIEEKNWVHISFDPKMRGQIMTATFDVHGNPTYTHGLRR